MESKDFIQAIIDLYQASRLLSYEVENVKRYKNRAVSGLSEDLLALCISKITDKDNKILIEAEIQITLGGSKKKICPDVTVCKGKTIGQLWDIKMDLGHKRIERNGLVFAKVVKDRTSTSLSEFVSKHVATGTTVYTDDLPSYGVLANNYKHSTVNHSAHQYTNGDIFTNTVESYFSHFKRMLYGTHHQISLNHIQRYVDEFTVRFNNRFMPVALAFEKTVQHSEGHALCKHHRNGLWEKKPKDQN